MSLSLNACGDDEAGQETASATFTGGTNDPTAASMGTGGTSTGTTGNSDSDGTGDSNSNSNSNSDGTSESGGDDPCEDIDCSGHGVCADVAGQPTCDCDEGYIAEDLECISCPLVSGELDVDIPMITLQPEFTVNGKIANDGDGIVFLSSLTGGVRLGDVAGTPAPVRVIPGTYDLRYDVLNKGDGIPDNSNTLFGTGVQVDKSEALPVDVPMVTRTGTLTVNGQVPGTFGDGYLYYVEPEGSGRVFIGDVDNGSYAIEIIPGTYDIIYDVLNDEDGLPDNNNAVVAKGVVIGESGASNIDVPMVTRTGSLTVNGQVPGTFGDGYVYYVNRATGDRAFVGDADNGAYSLEIIPGTYDVLYRVINDEDGLPDNRNAIVAEGVTISDSGAANIDIPMITRTGNLTVNGKVPGTSGDGYVYYVNRETGDRVLIGDADNGSYAIELIPGTYDILYSVINNEDGLPDNSNAIVEEGVQITESGVANIDIPMLTRTGNLTVNGKVPGVSGDGYLYYVNLETGDRAFIGDVDTGAYSLELIPGTYDILYSVLNDEDGLPDNRYAIIAKGVSISESGAANIDLPMVSLAGVVTVNGQLAANGEGFVYLSSESDIVRIANTANPSYTAELLPGTYMIYYDVQNYDTGVPRNSYTKLGCVQIN